MKVILINELMNLTAKPIMLTSILIFSLTLLIIQLSPFETTIEVKATPSTTSIVSTRGHFNPYSGHPNSFFYDERSYHPISIPSCSPALTDVVIFVHGFYTNDGQVIYQSNLVKKSLNSLGINYSIIGFSWDSNAIGSFYPPRFPWEVAIDIANQNGIKLASFISDFKSQPQCEHVNIRLVSHSLGARVVLNTLKELHDPFQFQLWNQNDFTVASIHLLGAAINPLEVSTRSGYSGIPIQEETEYLLNGYCLEDDILQFTYYNVELHAALGTVEASDMVPTSGNYDDFFVCDHISRDSNGDGIDDLDNYGDNHMGYLGVMDRNGNLSNVGAMDLVVNHWNSE
jgi:pimeloyl-ACP methyl ester carboxylesterase